MIEPNTKRKCYVCDSNKIIKVFTNFKNKNKHYYCKDCADKYIIHKPKQEVEMLSRRSKQYASCLGEKQKIVKCSVCHKKAKFDKEASQYYCNKCGWWICV